MDNRRVRRYLDEYEKEVRFAMQTVQRNKTEKTKELLNYYRGQLHAIQSIRKELGG